MKRLFRVKNLAIQIDPEDLKIRLWSWQPWCCLPWTCPRFSIPTCHWCPYTTFDPCTGCPRTSFYPDTKIDLDELKILKEQLRKSLAQVERQEKIMEEMEAPQTTEEVEMMEQALAKMSEEVQARRKEIERRTSE